MSKNERSWKKITPLVVALAVFLCGLLTILTDTTNQKKEASWAVFAYGALVSVFLIIQFVGFISSQVTYEEEIEEAKFQVLRLERDQWER